LASAQPDAGPPPPPTVEAALACCNKVASVCLVLLNSGAFHFATDCEGRRYYVRSWGVRGTTRNRTISFWTLRRSVMPGKRTSGCAILESVGQNSACFIQCVPARSKQGPPMISQASPLDFTVVDQFGHFVCVRRRCAPYCPFANPEVCHNQK